MSDTIFKRTDLRRIDRPGVARYPVQTPQPRLGIKKPQGKTLEKLAFLPGKLGRGIGVRIGGAGEDF